MLFTVVCALERLHRVGANTAIVDKAVEYILAQPDGKFLPSTKFRLYPIC